ncbi:hypothetical protein GJR96_01910 [Haloferax sp. MBLA0076]|uniref:Small CPxCG-related zinc finger protein n=1 Tax=Haloferax litoreum TaxID=2666140 RepID=A0A6A8GC71_9EURY|nr:MULTISPECIES: hypothetical protein [Haloferax]KAB1192261.1 hypothetical protein Hfx1148_01900 [Haloferax sp. CBA1148]MRX20718.1 hypothetical protein [Haloferax litoreum]
MSHTPELPERFVCDGCHVVYAGTVEHRDGTYHYSAPDECAACGSTEFVSFEQYVRHKTA